MTQAPVNRFTLPVNQPIKHADDFAPEASSIRLLYLGQIPGWQTQAAYHTVAELMTEETPDTIIISQPADPYVCLGFHQKLDHVFDREACKKKDIPIIRRKIGGGGTFLNSDQLFYQCIFHTSRVSANSAKVYEQMLAPVINTLSHYPGIEAELVGSHEIEIKGKRIAGIGGGQIGESNVVVGNILFDFDFDSAAAMWSVPNEAYRALGKQAMQDHMITLDSLGSDVPMDKVADQLIQEYEKHFKRNLNPSGLSMAEIERAGLIGASLKSESFLNHIDDDGPRKPLKIARDVFIHCEEFNFDEKKIVGNFRVESGMIHSVKFNDSANKLESAVLGKPFEKWKEIVSSSIQ